MTLSIIYLVFSYNSRAQPLMISAARSVSSIVVSALKEMRKIPSAVASSAPVARITRLKRVLEEHAEPVPTTTPLSSSMCSNTSPRSPRADALTIYGEQFPVDIILKICLSRLFFTQEESSSACL